MDAPTPGLLELLRLERVDDNSFVGESRNIVGGRVFGGQLLGQALAAAAGTVDGRIAHSLQGYFLLPGDACAPIVYRVEPVRDGGTFSIRRVLALQAERVLVQLSASFQSLENGLEHQCDMPVVPDPESLPDEIEAKRQFLEAEPISDNFRAALLRPQPLEIRPIAPDHPLRPRDRSPARQCWMRAPGPLPEDASLHQALLAYASDYSLLGVALQPHGLSFLDRKLQAASLDHVMWFHRPVRMDEWLLYSMESPVSAGTRGFIRGQVFSRDGALVASTSQEGMIRKTA